MSYPVLHIVNGLAPDADLMASAVTTDRIRVPGAGKLLFDIGIGVGATGTTTITANSHIAVSGGTPTLLTFRYKVSTAAGAEIHNGGGWTTATTAGYLTIAGSNKRILVEFRHDELTDGEPYVSLTCTESVDSPVDAYITAIIIDGDRPGDNNVTYIA